MNRLPGFGASTGTPKRPDAPSFGTGVQAFLIMTHEQIERNRAFLVDLRANPLKAKETMREAGGGRCCLCVAYDTAQRLGACLDDADEHLPPIGIASFYGWDRSNPRLVIREGRMAASCLNDGIGTPELTHAEIADAFEATFPELKL